MKVARRVLRGPRRSNAPGLPDGATADRVFTLGADGDLDRQAAYTALSRGRVENRLYMLEPDDETQQILSDPNPVQSGRELLLEHAERELSRDRSQHRASERLVNLPEPEGARVAHSVEDLFDQLPEPVGPRAHSSPADDLLAELQDPVGVEPDLADKAAKISAHLDALEQPSPSIADDYGIDLW